MRVWGVLYGGCPLPGLSSLLLRPWWLTLSAQVTLSQQPVWCAVGVSYPSSRWTTLIFLCMLLGLNCSWSNMTHRVLSVSVSTRPDIIFPPGCPWKRKKNVLCTFPTDSRLLWNMFIWVTSSIWPSWKSQAAAGSCVEIKNVQNFIVRLSVFILYYVN